MITLGIAGTAKNTGKTTTLSSIIDELYKNNEKIALTSIGYDGEEIDNVTGLFKPRYKLKEGMILATANKTLKKINGTFEEICNTEIPTPLGKVKVVKVKKEGLFVVAGPNKGSEIEKIKKLFYNMGIKFMLIDGALNRIAPMENTDAIIIATGAAMNTDIERISDNAKAISYIFNDIDKVQDEIAETLEGIERVTIFKERDFIKMSFNSLLDYENLDEVLGKIEKNDIIYIPGLCINYLLEEFLNKLIEKNFRTTIIFKNPVRLLLAGAPEKTMEVIYKAVLNGINCKYLGKISLLAFTINPYYPLYNPLENVYKEAYIDELKLKESMLEKTSVPVINIKEDGPQKLINIIESFKYSRLIPL
ncbi:hypothetical protein [Thermovenabulum sp.]|uniref:lysine 5,6-aminomutase reactivase subunit KamB n=1 Tax=Thermovenabulum sp. TaxID=3100335 RepID=UPI003C79A7EC